MIKLNWKASYSKFESKEEALIRMYNDQQLREEFKGGRRFLFMLAAEFNTTVMAVNKKLGRLREAKIVGHLRDYNQPRLIVADKKVADPALPQNFLKLMVDGNKLLNQRDVRQSEVYPEYDTPNWVGLAVGGDWHFEHYRVDIETLVEDLKFIGREPNLFYGFLGDMGDFIDLRFMELENDTIDIPLRRRYEVIRYLFSLVPNTLFAVTGCHDNWVRTRGRWDIIEGIQEEIMGYYLGFGGTVNFRVGNATYRIAAYHKFGFESQTNHFHPNYKYLWKMDSKADVVAIAHRHDIVGVAHVYIQGIPRMFIRSGSQQYRTNYAWKEGFRGAIARWPMILLNGTEKRMIMGVNVREGIPILRALNTGKLTDIDALNPATQVVHGMESVERGEEIE